MQKEQNKKEVTTARKRQPSIAAKIRRCSELLMKRNAEAYRKLATR